MGEKKEIVPVAEMSVEELQKEKVDLENLLASLEDQYRGGSVSEKAYKEVKGKNKKRYDEVCKVLVDFGIIKMPDPGEKKKEAKTEEKPSKETPSETQTKSPPTVPSEKPSHTPPTNAPQETPQAAVSVAMPSGGPGFKEEIARQLELTSTKFNAELEKVKSLMEVDRESKKSIDERMQTMSEGIGELRSMVYQREGKLKEDEIKLEKIDEEVSGLKPEAVSKEFAKRDTSIGKDEMRIEKLEMKTSDLIKKIGDVRDLLKSIGGLENIATVNKDIAQKMTTMNEISKGVDRVSNKIQKIYVDLEKKLEEFLLYKAKQDTIDELTKELMKTVDIMNIKQEDFISKEDLKTLKENINALTGKVIEMKKTVDMILPIVKTKIPDHIRSLQRQKQGIEMLLSTLEEGFKSGIIEKKEYEKALKSNQKQLTKIENQLKKEWEKMKKSSDAKMNEEKKESEPVKEKAAESEKKQEKNVEKEEEKEENKTEKITEIPEKEEEKEAQAESVSETEKDESEEGEDKKVEEKNAKPEGNKNESTSPEKEAKNTAETKKKSKEVSKGEKTKAEKPNVNKNDIKFEAAPEEKEEKKKEAPDTNKELLAELEDTFKRGLIGKEAYEKTKEALQK